MTPFGDRAVRFAVPEGAPRRRLVAELSAIPGVRDVVLAEEIGCAVFDEVEGADGGARAEVAARLASRPETERDDPGREHVIRVVYDGDDLDDVARALGKHRRDVVALHAGARYRVAMLGFMPGFAYLAGLPPELRLPRRAPRPRVRAGSVAIAADYTGIYPFASPGGWHLLGRAVDFAPFSGGSAAAPDGRAVLAIGDLVRFAPAAELAPARASEAPARGPEQQDTRRPSRAPAAAEASAPPPRPHLEITRAGGVAILVDGGRPGRMRDGVPPGGPLARARFDLANHAAGNAAGACAIELSGTLEVTARGGRVTIADDVAGAVTLGDGERHVVSTEGRARARYLALAGGIEAPVVLGGRGALLVAGIGALLRRGARLTPLESATPAEDGAPPAGSSTAAERPSVSNDSFDDAPPIVLMPGPDASDAARDALASRLFRVSAASDRTGTRLDGLAPSATDIASHAQRSTPMVLGAIELTPSGLIVLGPDHPTTGGYPVVAVVRSSSLDRFFERPIGAPVRFVFS